MFLYVTADDVNYCLFRLLHTLTVVIVVRQGISRPTRVTAAGSTGVATGSFDIETEDTITLLVQWENLEDGSK